MRDPIIDASGAAGLIGDGATVLVGGSGGMGVAEAVLVALEARFLAEARPRDLTLLHTTGIGAVTEHGLNHLAHEGLVRRVIGGNYGLQLPFMKKLIGGNRIEAYNFPQGVMCQLYRAMAAGLPGAVSHVGLHTFIDPRHEGGRMNEATRDDLIEVVTLGGRELLFYAAPVPDIALIRATSADPEGNVGLEHEAATLDGLSMAQAAHNAGGTVICQVERLVDTGALHPQMARIPGFLIDHVVVEPGQMQNYAVRFDPSLCGAEPRDLETIPPDPLDARRLIARRAAFELRPGAVINLGVGISAAIPNVVAEEGIEDLVHPTIEAGVVGGIPGQGLHFGSAVNPRVILDQGYMFDFYDGGGLDIAFVSFAEVDRHGHVNVTRFGDRNDGAGGFIDITQNAKRIVFGGTLTGGGLRVAIGETGLGIEREGGIAKFVPEVGQISYNGTVGRERGQEVLFVTERAVLRPTTDGLMVTEIAPGIRLREDVVERIGFEVAVAPDLREMDPRLYRPGRMGLREAILPTEGT